VYFSKNIKRQEKFAKPCPREKEIEKKIHS
jgi:hypothetical protein